ncbi:MAG TPA: hypothetical protein VFR56_02065 [Actinomycetes bacterium]|nr:hypothetical protein [Actinomycetes bacterium]
MTAQTVAAVLATGEEKARELPAEPWVIGVGVFVVLVVLLAITLSFGKDR